MPIQHTLAIIKPDAMEKNLIGKIITKIEEAGLKVVQAKMLHLDRKQAEGFYAVHKERPFFSSLVSFMIRGPVLIMVLEGENAIKKYREIMGATNPKDAAPNTIRADYASSIEENAVHGSDGEETAAFEISYFFKNPL